MGRKHIALQPAIQPHATRVQAGARSMYWAKYPGFIYYHLNPVKPPINAKWLLHLLLSRSSLGPNFKKAETVSLRIQPARAKQTRDTEERKPPQDVPRIPNTRPHSSRSWITGVVGYVIASLWLVHGPFYGMERNIDTLEEKFSKDWVIRLTQQRASFTVGFFAQSRFKPHMQSCCKLSLRHAFAHAYAKWTREPFLAKTSPETQ